MSEPRPGTAPTRHPHVRLPSRAWLPLFLASLVVAGVRPPTASAQVEGTVVGRVVDAASGSGIPNAAVFLEGHGSVLSADQGAFRFERVAPGEYVLRADAIGYEPLETTVTVSGDTVFALPLRVVPIELDELRVDLGRIDFDGRVRDPGTDSYVYEAEVRSDQGHRESTSLSGRFDLDDVFDGPPLRIGITAFSFLPLDTTFIPDDEERHTFDLSPDAVMARMIGDYVARLDDRAGERAYEYRPPLNRADLARLSPRMSLQMALERRYPPHIVRRIGCLFLDEREYRFGSELERLSVMEGTVVNELERVELLEFPGYAQLYMARVYTRRFFQRNVGTDGELDIPSMVSTPGGILCR